MSLDWNIGGCRNFEEFFIPEAERRPTDDTFLRPVTHYLIWSTIPYGLNKITAENVGEWLFRSHLFHTQDWNLIFAPGTHRSRPFTRAEIERHIGLRTNATPMTRLQFMKSVGQRLERQTKDEMSRAKLSAAHQREDLGEDQSIGHYEMGGDEERPQL